MSVLPQINDLSFILFISFLFMPHGSRIAELLLDIGAVKISVDPPFTWTSGIKSPIYCDNRMLYGHPDARKFIVDAFIQRIGSLQVEPDVIAGTATAAIGWAAMVADRMNLPFIYVRSKAKEHGAKKRIEGDLRKGKDILLIEDLISTGGSAISSVEALREEGEANVFDILAIFSYQLPMSLELADRARVKLHMLSDLTSLLVVAKNQGRLSDEEIEKVTHFAKDTSNWL